MAQSPAQIEKNELVHKTMTSSRALYYLAHSLEPVAVYEKSTGSQVSLKPAQFLQTNVIEKNASFVVAAIPTFRSKVVVARSTST